MLPGAHYHTFVVNVMQIVVLSALTQKLWGQNCLFGIVHVTCVGEVEFTAVVYVVCLIGKGLGLILVLGGLLQERWGGWLPPRGL